MSLASGVWLREPGLKLRSRDVDAAPSLACLNQLYSHPVQISIRGVGPGTLLHFRQRQPESMEAIDCSDSDRMLDAGGIPDHHSTLFGPVELIPHIRRLFAIVAGRKRNLNRRLVLTGAMRTIQL
jgi:hypothetical protein